MRSPSLLDAPVGQRSRLRGPGSVQNLHSVTCSCVPLGARLQPPGLAFVLCETAVLGAQGPDLAF